jgi:hypothetical protein
VFRDSRSYDGAQDNVSRVAVTFRDVQSSPCAFDEIDAKRRAALARYGCGKLHGVRIRVAEVAIDMGATGNGQDA